MFKFMTGIVVGVLLTLQGQGYVKKFEKQIKYLWAEVI